MRLLAFDTSSKVGALVALDWDPSPKLTFNQVRLISEWNLNIDTGFHSERLLWGIHEILEAARWKLADVDVFGVGTGPGSFTGLRIGLTTARTLASLLSKPLVGVSSLAALARPAAMLLAPSATLSLARGPSARCKKMQDPLVIAATDACKGELFALWGPARAVRGSVCLADGDLAGLWQRGVFEKVIRPEALMAELKKKLKGHSNWIAVGEASHRYSEFWKGLPENKHLELTYLYPDFIQGRFLGMLVWEAYQAGLAREALKVHPRYLRASDAELKLQAGLLSSGPSRKV